jgi:TATA-binding protein-associated factor Taf7
MSALTLSDDGQTKQGKSPAEVVSAKEKRAVDEKDDDDDDDDDDDNDSDSEEEVRKAPNELLMEVSTVPQCSISSNWFFSVK